MSSIVPFDSFMEMMIGLMENAQPFPNLQFEIRTLREEEDGPILKYYARPLGYTATPWAEGNTPEEAAENWFMNPVRKALPELELLPCSELVPS